MARDGKFIIVKVGNVTVLGQTSGSLEYTVDMLETTDKLSKDPTTGITHKTYIQGDRDGTISIDFNTKDDANGFPLLYNLYNTQTVSATIYYGSDQAGGKYYSQSGFLSNLSTTDPMNAISTGSATFQKSGAPTEATVSS
jgi:hypothetical protein